MPSLRARIVITPANPSRRAGYQVAHFLLGRGTVVNVWQRDRFLSTLSRALRWVARNYPKARLRVIRQNHHGEIAGYAFECPASFQGAKRRLAKH